MKIGLFVKPRAHFNRGILNNVLTLFKASNFELVYDSNLARITKEKAGDFAKVDVIFSLGGDGTVLKAARLAYKYNKPLIGVNLGNLGFLTEVNLDDLERFLKKFNPKKMKRDERSLLQIELGKFKTEVLNEVALGRGMKAKLIKINASLDAKDLCELKADGLIVATPTGSTAYSISAGGPIVMPNSKAVVFNPVCPHKLSNRPLVLDNFKQLKVQADENLCLFCDGVKGPTMRKGEELKIKILSQKITFLRHKKWNFFEVLKSKLDF